MSCREQKTPFALWINTIHTNQRETNCLGEKHQLHVTVCKPQLSVTSLVWSSQSSAPKLMVTLLWCFKESYWNLVSFLSFPPICVYTLWFCLGENPCITDGASSWEYKDVACCIILDVFMEMRDVSVAFVQLAHGYVFFFFFVIYYYCFWGFKRGILSVWA